MCYNSRAHPIYVTKYENSMKQLSTFTLLHFSKSKRVICGYLAVINYLNKLYLHMFKYSLNLLRVPLNPNQSINIRRVLAKLYLESVWKKNAFVPK